MNHGRHLRTRIEIAGEITELCLQAMVLTHIMRSAHLSYTQTREYLQYVREKGLVEKEVIRGKHFFKTTMKGRDFLYAYERIMQLIDINADQPVHKRYSVTS